MFVKTHKVGLVYTYIQHTSYLKWPRGQIWDIFVVANRSICQLIKCLEMDDWVSGLDQGAFAPSIHPRLYQSLL